MNEGALTRLLASGELADCIEACVNEADYADCVHKCLCAIELADCD